MVIRELCEADYPSVCSLINIELGYSEITLGELTARLELMSQDDDYRAFIALADGKVVGFVGTFRGIAFEMKGFYLRVIALAVSLDYRNIGIGRSLIKHVEDYAGTLGITAFAVNSGLKRQNAHTFYEHCGFSKRTYGFGKDTSF